MAIAYDTVLADGTGGPVTSFTQAFTITGSDTALVLAIMHTTTANVTSATYAGASMTQIHANLVAEATNRLDMWFLKGTATGSNNIVVNFGASDIYRRSATSYTGVGTGGGTGGSDSQQSQSWSSVSGNQTVTTTTNADNCWVAFYGRTADAYTASTNVTYRNSISNVVFIGDNAAAVTPAGALSQVFARAGTSTGVIGTIGMAPVAAASGPANLKSLDTNVKSNIKSYNTNLIANMKSLNTNA